jgi:hypothetical protein
MTDYNRNKNTLCLYFPEEISHIILSFKSEQECEEIRDFMIERDFYNWLNHDLINRVSYNCDSFTSLHCDYYIIHLNSLGLNSVTHIEDNLRRTKSLNDCYNSPWWKTTSKNYIQWNIVHKSLMMFHDNFIFIWDKDYNFENEDPFHMLIYNWRKPKMKEKIEILNRYTPHELERYHNDWLETMTPMLFSKDISLII